MDKERLTGGHDTESIVHPRASLDPMPKTCAIVPAGAGQVVGNPAPVPGRRPIVQVVAGALGALAANVVAAVVVLISVLDDPPLAHPVATIFGDPEAFTIMFLVYAPAGLGFYYAISTHFAPHASTARGIGRELLAGVAIGAALIVTAVGVLSMLGVYHGHSPALRPGIPMGLAMSLGAACAEEAFFRGILLRVLNERWGSTIAVLVNGVTFGAIHLPNDGVDWWGATALVLSGTLLLPCCYLITGRIWASAGIHFAWNATMNSVFGITVSGAFMEPGILVGSLTGAPWLSGGAMGLEGSAVCVGGSMAAGFVALALCLRSGHWRSFTLARAEVKTQ